MSNVKKYMKNQQAAQRLGDSYATKVNARANKKYGAVINRLNRKLTNDNRLLAHRENSRKTIAQINRDYVHATKDVLNSKTLDFLVSHSKIDVPTITSIFAGFELARSSRADKLKELRDAEIENIRAANKNAEFRNKMLNEAEKGYTDAEIALLNSQNALDKELYSTAVTAAQKDSAFTESIQEIDRRGAVDINKQNNTHNNQVIRDRASHIYNLREGQQTGDYNIARSTISNSRRSSGGSDSNGNTYRARSSRQGVIGNLQSQITGQTDAQRLAANNNQGVTVTSNGSNINVNPYSPFGTPSSPQPQYLFQTGDAPQYLFQTGDAPQQSSSGNLVDQAASGLGTGSSTQSNTTPDASYQSRLNDQLSSLSESEIEQLNEYQRRGRNNLGAVMVPLDNGQIGFVNRGQGFNTVTLAKFEDSPNGGRVLKLHDTNRRADKLVPEVDNYARSVFRDRDAERASAGYDALASGVEAVLDAPSRLGEAIGSGLYDIVEGDSQRKRDESWRNELNEFYNDQSQQELRNTIIESSEDRVSAVNEAVTPPTSSPVVAAPTTDQIAVNSNMLPSEEYEDDVENPVYAVKPDERLT